ETATKVISALSLHAALPTLTTGKKEHLDVFLSACRKSIEAAKRVNAKWMTVVPGFFERNLPIGIQTANVIEAYKRGAELFRQARSEEHTSELQSRENLVCRL